MLGDLELPASIRGLSAALQTLQGMAPRNYTPYATALNALELAVDPLRPRDHATWRTCVSGGLELEESQLPTLGPRIRLLTTNYVTCT